MKILSGLSISAFFFAASSSLTYAQDCPSYVGQTVSYTDVNELVSKLKKVPTIKDEFETTAQFQERQSKAAEGLVTPLFIPAIFDNEYVKYDADNETLNVKSFAISNVNTNYDAVFGYGGPMYEKVEYNMLGDNVDAVVKYDEKVTGSYVATNSFGVSTQVTRVTRNVVSIFDHKGEYGESAFTPPREQGGGYPDNVVASFTNTPVNIARKAKTTLGGGFLVALRAPYYVEGIDDSHSPTINNPREITVDLKVIMADILCGVLTDENNKVFASFTSR